MFLLSGNFLSAHFCMTALRRPFSISTWKLHSLLHVSSHWDNQTDVCAAEESALGAGGKWMWADPVIAIFASTLYGPWTWQCGQWGGKLVTSRYPAPTSLSLAGLVPFGEDSNKSRTTLAAGLLSQRKLKYWEMAARFGVSQHAGKNLNLKGKGSISIRGSHGAWDSKISLCQTGVMWYGKHQKLVKS